MLQSIRFFQKCIFITAFFDVWFDSMKKTLFRSWHHPFVRDNCIFYKSRYFTFWKLSFCTPRGMEPLSWVERLFCQKVSNALLISLYILQSSIINDFLDKRLRFWSSLKRKSSHMYSVLIFNNNQNLWTSLVTLLWSRSSVSMSPHPKLSKSCPILKHCLC